MASGALTSVIRERIFVQDYAKAVAIRRSNFLLIPLACMPTGAPLGLRTDQAANRRIKT
jgi:hypothetical protein